MVAYEVIIFAMFWISQHSVKLVSWMNCLARTTKLAEVVVVEGAAMNIVVVWIVNVRVRHYFADVGNKVVAVLGGGKEGSGAR